jgi:PAS domain-containing protein
MWGSWIAQASVEAATRAANWESAALLIGLAVLVGAIGIASSKVISVVRSGNKQLGEGMRSEVRKANGAPVKFFESCPMPAWFKDAEYKMSMMNQAYAAVFGVTEQEYLGKTDYEVWPREIADLFRQHDEQVVARRVQIRVTEDVPVSRAPDAPIYQWRVIKFPVIDQITNVVLGVGGYAYPINHPDYVNDSIAGSTTPTMRRIDDNED